MKTTMLLLQLLLYALCCNAQTYQRKTPEEKARKYTLEMMTEIPLDKELEPAIYEINLQVSKQFDSLYAAKPDKEASRAGMIAIFRGRDAALRKVMSKEQFLRFDDLQQEKRRLKLEKQQKQQEQDRGRKSE